MAGQRDLGQHRTHVVTDVDDTEAGEGRAVVHATQIHAGTYGGALELVGVGRQER